MYNVLPKMLAHLFEQCLPGVLSAAGHNDALCIGQASQASLALRTLGRPFADLLQKNATSWLRLRVRAWSLAAP